MQILDAYLAPRDRAFREEVRAFLREHLPPRLARQQRSHSHLPREDVVAWHQILNRHGWGAPSWPREYGGTDWTPLQRYLFEDECALADAPALSLFGISMVGPVIYTFGTAAQKERFLPPIVAMTEHWCQGYSEPGAGSDLAGLRTRAEADGDDYVVTGSKIWTSDAHKADWMFCLVRTDAHAKQQKGISFLLIDMRTPGITVRPIISIDGGHTLNEVFFDNVRVPRENLVGEENSGWTYAKFLLGHERSATPEISRTKRRMVLLREIAATMQSGGRPLAQDPHFALRLAGAQVELDALELTNLRLLLGEEGGGDVMASASMMKLRGSEVMQLVTELTLDALGPGAMPYEEAGDGSSQTPGAPDCALGRVEDYLLRRAATIYAGSSETQRNILAKLIFGT
jgi:alkylation response protein AidB-like acyl-CoA dehydrogenase